MHYYPLHLRLSVQTGRDQSDLTGLLKSSLVANE